MTAHTNELHPEACRCALCAPEDGGDEAMTEHDDLWQEYRKAGEESRAAHALVRAIDRRLDSLALRIMEEEGRGHAPAAEWLRAHLAGDMATCARIRKAHPHDYHRTPDARIGAGEPQAGARDAEAQP